MRTVLRNLNEYFFEIEEDEPADVLGASLFYGVCLLGVVISVTVAVVSVI